MSETMQELPAVGKSFYVDCKKCGTERYHTVLAHKTARSAKVKCEVCGSQKSYSLPKVQQRTKPSRPRTKAPTEEMKRNAHSAEYDKLMQEHETNPTQNYNMKIKFELNHKLHHPKFGLGLVRSVHLDKIEVVFPDEVRNLVHNRT